MAEIIADYFSGGWRERVIACPCAWEGDSRAMRMELHDSATDYACPACEATLLIVAHPDIEQVRRAAAEGNAEAKMQLEIVEEARAFAAARTGAGE
jgi:hypothetical protein